MIAFIRGIVQSYSADYVVIDHNGMGWQISYPHTDKIHLNDELTVYTYMHVSENDIGLYGFESQEEKDLFMRLISVKGLGPKTAMNMLAKSGVNDIISAVETGNVSTLKHMPGIGAKTASQIILDLKGKLVEMPSNNQNGSKNSYPSEINDACEGLKNLGYKQSEVNSAADYMNRTQGLTTEQYLKLGLQYLMKEKIGGRL